MSALCCPTMELRWVVTHVEIDGLRHETGRVLEQKWVRQGAVIGRERPEDCEWRAVPEISSLNAALSTR